MDDGGEVVVDNPHCADGGDWGVWGGEKEKEGGTEVMENITSFKKGGGVLKFLHAIKQKEVKKGEFRLPTK